MRKVNRTQNRVRTLKQRPNVCVTKEEITKKQKTIEGEKESKITEKKQNEPEIYVRMKPCDEAALRWQWKPHSQCVEHKDIPTASKTT